MSPQRTLTDETHTDVHHTRRTAPPAQDATATTRRSRWLTTQSVSRGSLLLAALGVVLAITLALAGESWPLMLPCVSVAVAAETVRRTAGRASVDSKESDD